MKRLSIVCIACLLLGLFACVHADAPAPGIPEGDFEALDVPLIPGRQWPVYTGPGEEYRQAGAGRARVSSDGWVQVLGGEGWAYLLVQYAVGRDRLRIGWISADAVPESYRIAPITAALGQAFRWRESHLNRAAALTDDPLMSQSPVIRLPSGARLQYLARMGDWAYVEAMEGDVPVCGFVPADSVTQDPVRVDSHPAFADAAALLKRAGIAAVPTGIRHRHKTIYFDLALGGTFWAYYYGDRYHPVLTPLEFNCKFENAVDDDIARYLDVALSMLAEVEQGVIDQAAPWADVDSARETKVSNGLLYQEYLGAQGLRVLLGQLARHDGQDALNSMRARLASRLLGIRDRTPVDPASGCAWYDALTLARQDALPPVDAGVYTQDPLLRAATQLLIAHYGEMYRGYSSDPENDVGKCATIVSLGECAREVHGPEATLWVSMGCELISVYDGSIYRGASGSWFPVRISLERARDGAWRLTGLTEPGDGTEYWPGILRMCRGNRKLAQKMLDTDCGIGEAKYQYLMSLGFPAAAQASRE